MTLSALFLQVLNSSSGDSVTTTDGSTPLLVSVSVPVSVNTTAYQCRYWNSDMSCWSSTGTVVVGFDQDSVTGAVIAYCGSLHLTDFSGRVNTSFMQVNAIDPISDAGDLVNVFSPSSRFAAVLVIALVGSFFVTWSLAVKADAKAERERKMVTQGGFRVSRNHCLRAVTPCQ